VLNNENKEIPINLEEYFKLQWSEASSAYRAIHDIVIKLISIILPLSIALSGFGITAKSWLLLILSALICFILLILIFSTYSRLKVIWGALLSYEESMNCIGSLPGLYTTYAKVHLKEGFVSDAKLAFKEGDREKQITSFKDLQIGYIGTPAAIITIGLLLLIISNLILVFVFI